MILTCRVPFDRGSVAPQSQFREFCDWVCASEEFRALSEPRIIREPLLSYDRAGLERLSEARDSIEGRHAIVYLCDIDGYGSVMLSLPERASLKWLRGTVYEYGSYEQLLERPTVVGYHMPDRFWRHGSITSDTVVISQIPWSLWDDDTDEPNARLVEVLRSRPHECGAVYAYRIRELDEYFELIGGNDPVYFFGSGLTIPLDQCLAAYESDTLTADLHDSGVEFATIDDCHQDDSFAVSYRVDMWRIPPVWLTIVA